MKLTPVDRFPSAGCSKYVQVCCITIQNICSNIRMQIWHLFLIILEWMHPTLMSLCLQQCQSHFFFGVDASMFVSMHLQQWQSQSPAENPLNAVWLKTSATKLTCTYCRDSVGGKVTGSQSWWQCCKYIWASCVIIAFSREGHTKIPACWW